MANAHFWIFCVILCIQQFGLTFRIVRNNDFQRSNTAIVRGALSFKSSRIKCSSIRSSTVLLLFATPISRAECTNRFRRKAFAAQSGNRRHTRIIPAIDNILRPPAASSFRLLITVFVTFNRANSYCCGHCSISHSSINPIIERTLILKLQRTDRMRNAFNRILERMSIVIHRINAPSIASMVMVSMSNTVNDGITQIDIRRGHIDLRPQDFSPSSNSPARIRANKSKFSSTLRSR